MWTAMNNSTDKKEEDKCGVDGSSTREIAIHTPQQLASTQNRTNNEIISTAPSNSNKENNALILHSPILSLLPNSNIKQFEADVLKKQLEYAGRITDMEARLATFHNRLAVESMDRGREHANTLEQYIVEPIEDTTRRSLQKINSEFVMPIMNPTLATASTSATAASTPKINNGDDQVKKTGDSSSLPNLVSIERHSNQLEARMNHHKHVTLYHSRKHNFDSIDQECRKTVSPELALEMTKADKREVGLKRRFDASSGEFSRLSAEMTASRQSSLGLIEKAIDDWDISDLSRAEYYLAEIQKLKQRVLKEREERIRQDELVVEKIIHAKKTLEEDIFLAC